MARNNLTTHTDKYRMNDVTTIYRIVEINRAFIYLFKNFVSINMNLSISSPQKTADNTQMKYMYFPGRNIDDNSKLF